MVRDIFTLGNKKGYGVTIKVLTQDPESDISSQSCTTHGLDLNSVYGLVVNFLRTLEKEFKITEDDTNDRTTN